jgi:hypothetical protein
VLKKHRLAQLRALIDSVPIGEAFNYAQLARLNALTGWGVVAAVHAENPTHPRDPRHVRVQQDPGGPFVARSWIKAVSPVSDTGKLLSACRFAVSDQMHAWLTRQPKACAHCGSDRDPTADHTGVPFIDMVSRWAGDREPGELLRNRSAVEVNTGVGALLLPAPWKEWRKFHEENASYQVLCRSCNARKGARNG